MINFTTDLKMLVCVRFDFSVIDEERESDEVHNELAECDLRKAIVRIALLQQLREMRRRSLRWRPFILVLHVLVVETLHFARQRRPEESVLLLQCR